MINKDLCNRRKLQKVLKFGGTSVKNASAMKNVAAILDNYSPPIIVVLSAISGTTDVSYPKRIYEKVWSGFIECFLKRIKNLFQ